VRYNTNTKKERKMTVKEQLFAKIAEVEALLLQAECDGVKLTQEDNVFGELASTLNRLADEVDYYVD
jgi:hypothetical protein